MSLRIRRTAAIVAALLLGLCASARAAGTPSESPGPAGLTCAAYGPERICSGELASFDGTPLDVDVTLPLEAPGPRGSHPLIVMLHGFGNDKHEWESVNDRADGGDKWHWNSHWFAEHGYYVLTYTARGFRSDAAGEPWQPDTPTGSSQTTPQATIRLKSREFEIRDTQWLAATVAAAFPGIDPARVAVTGGSYGGGESWLQASQPTWAFPHRLDSLLPVLHLQVAVPKYGWTDLAYSLAPNGHPGPHGSYDPAQSRPDDPTGLSGAPLGVLKESYVTGFYAVGNRDGRFEEGTDPGPEEGPQTTSAWYARAQAGDPYPKSDPVVAALVRGLTVFRSAYYQDRAWRAQVGRREVAIFAIQGWTDTLFPAAEAFREFLYLKGLDPRWPVEVALGDVGHSLATNPPAAWHELNHRAWSFLQANIDGSHRQSTTVASLRTTCGEHPTSAITAPTPQGLARGTLSVRYPTGSTVSPVAQADPDDVTTDPIVGPELTGGDHCRVSSAPSAPGRYTGLSRPLARSIRYVGPGRVEVPYTLSPGATTAELAARVWDVAPSGRAVLVTRGIYRIDTTAGDPASGTLALPLFGNDWRFAAGHRIRLDLTQVDSPTFRPSNPPSTIALHRPTLVLPTRSAGDLSLAGGGAP